MKVVLLCYENLCLAIKKNGRNSVYLKTLIKGEWHPKYTQLGIPTVQLCSRNLVMQVLMTRISTLTWRVLNAISLKERHQNESEVRADQSHLSMIKIKEHLFKNTKELMKCLIQQELQAEKMLTKLVELHKQTHLDKITTFRVSQECKMHILPLSLCMIKKV